MLCSRKWEYLKCYNLLKRKNDYNEKSLKSELLDFGNDVGNEHVEQNEDMLNLKKNLFEEDNTSCL